MRSVITTLVLLLSTVFFLYSRDDSLPFRIIYNRAGSGKRDLIWLLYRGTLQSVSPPETLPHTARRDVLRAGSSRGPQGTLGVTGRSLPTPQPGDSGRRTLFAFQQRVLSSGKAAGCRACGGPDWWRTADICRKRGILFAKSAHTAKVLTLCTSVKVQIFTEVNSKDVFAVNETIRCTVQRK